MQKWIGVLAVSILIGGTADAQKGASLTPVDYEEIRALYSKYVYGYDTGDAQMVASVFARDATLVIGGKTTGDSRDTITGGIKPRVGVNGMRHIPTNILIESSPEGAKGMQYLTLMNFQDGKMPAVISGGVYHDAIIKTSEGWRFKRREVTWFSTPPAPTGSTASNP
jgi:hypothetical protein